MQRRLSAAVQQDRQRDQTGGYLGAAWPEMMLSVAGTMVEVMARAVRDLLAVDIDPKADRILGVSVSSYLEDDPQDAVTLAVAFGTFQDGTIYPAKIELDGQSKDLEIVIENEGYRKTGS